MNLITGCLPLSDLLNRKSKIHYCCSQMMTLIAKLKSMNSILEKKKKNFYDCRWDNRVRGANDHIIHGPVDGVRKVEGVREE